MAWDDWKWDDWRRPLAFMSVFFVGRLAIEFLLRSSALDFPQKRSLQNLGYIVEIILAATAALAVLMFVRSLYRDALAKQAIAQAPSEENAASASNAGNRATLDERWLALLRFDTEVREAADQLNPYGVKWVSELGRAFFALDEEREFLPNIVSRLKQEADQERVREEEYRWASIFSVTAEGETCTPEALAILKKAHSAGYEVSIDHDHTIVVSKGTGTSYLQSISDINALGKSLAQ
jgi:hypothetical protein